MSLFEVGTGKIQNQRRKGGGTGRRGGGCLLINSRSVGEGY